MKSSAYAATYDAYISCVDTIYENNTWKNNICFSPDKLNNTLMKSKGGNGIKKFIGNRFIVTEEFVNMLVSTHGASLDNCWVYFASNVDNSSWIIKDNVIDVYYLSFFTANDSAREWSIVNNDIRVKRIKGSLVPSSLKNADDTYPFSRSVFLNNTLVVQDSEPEIKSEISIFTLQENSDDPANMNHSTIEFANNTILGNSLKVNGSALCENCITSNNTIKVNEIIYFSLP